MNILFIAYSFNPTKGGVERVTNTISLGLKSRGYNIFFICVNPDGDNVGALVPVYSLSGQLENDKQKLITEYHEYLRNNHIDVIVNQYPIAQSSDFYLENALPGILKISFYHGRPLGRLRWEKKKYFYDFNIKAFIGICLRIKKEKDRFKRIFNISDKVVFLSSGYVKYIHKICKIDINKAVRIPNPNLFDFNHYLDLKSKKENIIIFVGRVSDAGKNLSDFVKVWCLIASKYPDWKAIVVGDDSGCDKIKESIENHRIPNIEFIGHQTDVSKFYEVAKINCITSHSEGWPMVLVEGLSYGCVPCVFDTFESVHELVTDSKNGYIVRPYDNRMMANRIENLITNPDLLDNMALEACRLIKCYSLSQVLDQWEQILK